MEKNTLLPEQQVAQAIFGGNETWEIDWRQGRLGGRQGGIEAIAQSAAVALSVPRYQHLIYSGDFGCEIESLIGKDYAYLCAAAAQILRECLLQDDRIEAVDSFTFSRCEDGADIGFRIVTRGGEQMNSVFHATAKGGRQ